jgi:hypothetical protein
MLFIRYNQNDQVKEDEMGRACSTHGREEGSMQAFGGKLEGKRLLGRPRSRWEDDIKIDHREIGWGGMDWIHMAQDRDQWQALVNMVTNIRVP